MGTEKGIGMVKVGCEKQKWDSTNVCEGNRYFFLFSSHPRHWALSSGQDSCLSGQKQHRFRQHVSLNQAECDDQ